MRESLPEPSERVTFRGNMLTGYGPEEYLLRRAINGEFKIMAKYFASHRADLAGATTILIRITTNFGRPGKECSTYLTKRLFADKEYTHVGNATFA